MEKKRVKILKSIISLMLVITMVLGQYSSGSAYTAKITTNYLAIQADKMDLNKKAVVNGYSEARDGEDYSDAVYYLLTSDCNRADSIDTSEDYIVEKPTYCVGNAKLNGAVYSGDNYFVSEKHINIKSSNVASEKCSLIYSKSGNITIHGDTVDFKGVICAPEGNIVIKADKVRISGCVMAKKVTIQSPDTEITPTTESSRLSTFLKNYKNEGYMLFDAYEEDGKLCVYCKPNLEMEKGTVYTRNKGEKKFTNIGEFKTNEGSIDGFSFEEQVDIIIEGKSIFGESILSDVITLAKDENGENYCKKEDTDNDGVADGLEIYYLKTDPDVADTDKDGIPDGIEVYNLCTEARVPDGKNKDFDRDGVTNLEEVRKKTDAFLSDTDFDGIKDGKDEEPRKYKKNAKADYVPTRSVGFFDIIITEIDEDGNCVQKLFDYINENTKIEREGDLVTSYHYDYEMKLSAKITEYKGEIKNNCYEYDGKTLTGIFNNGYEYRFVYNEEKALTEVMLNDVSLIKYSNSDSCSSIQYANGDSSSKTYTDNQVVSATTENGGYTYTYDEADKKETYVYNDSGLTICYVYDGSDALKKVETNTGFRIDYAPSNTENEYKNTVIYTIGTDTYVQENRITYNEEGSKSVASTLLNGETITRYFESDNTIIEKLTINETPYFKRSTYNLKGLPESIRYNDGTKEEYTYSSDSNMTRIKADDTVTNIYEYDTVNRLTSATNTKNNTIDLYEYDLSDNIKTVKTYTYDREIGELLSEDIYEYSDSYADQLIKFNGKEITYDASGKPLSYYDGSTFSWDGDRLESAKRNGKEISFAHNAEGIVLEKTVDGIITTYGAEGKDYIYETTNGKTIFYLYDAEANVIGFHYEGKTYYYAKNALNDVVKIMNSANEQVCSYNYDSWGNILSIEGDETIANLNKYRYRSYYYDTDMDMYYLRSRYYDSRLRRFISTDIIKEMVYNKENLNLYAYCKSNPVYYSDPEGTAVSLAIIAIEEFLNESDILMQDCMNYYGEKNFHGNLFKAKDMDELIETWNYLNNRRVVIIDTHGNEKNLVCKEYSINENEILNLEEINNLEFKAVKVLILLGCSAGYQDFRNSNVAYAFCNRISGRVVAGDGTVGTQSKAYLGETYLELNVWMPNGRTHRNTLGWMIYEKISNRISCNAIGFTKTTISGIMTYIKKTYSTTSYK